MILGIAVLSLLLVLCLGATWTLDRTADQVASLLESAWISETTEEAAAQVAAAQKIWEQNRGPMCLPGGPRVAGKCGGRIF